MSVSWASLLNPEKQKPYFQDLMSFIQARRDSGVRVLPEQSDIYQAFSLCPLNNVKVVILGQDPYHKIGQAHGLSFSVQKGVQIPPSLKNIYKELATSIEGFSMPSHGKLNCWAEQGVLLLNTVLTVEEATPNAHKNKGWERFTDFVISCVSAHTQDTVFLLWGKPAQQKSALIDKNKHHILKSVHPSPLSAYRGFLGCQHFSKANLLLDRVGKTPIDWQV